MVTHAVISGQSCSWCHEYNRLPSDGSAVYCHNCGHRADVPRLMCDCEGCCALRAEHVALALKPGDRADLTEFVKAQVILGVRQHTTAMDRVAFRQALYMGLDYESWRAGYVRGLSAKLQAMFRRMDAAGVDVEAILRAVWDTLKSMAVN